MGSNKSGCVMSKCSNKFTLHSGVKFLWEHIFLYTCQRSKNRLLEKAIVLEKRKGVFQFVSLFCFDMNCDLNGKKLRKRKATQSKPD